MFWTPQGTADSRLQNPDLGVNLKIIDIQIAVVLIFIRLVETLNWGVCEY